MFVQHPDSLMTDTSAQVKTSSFADVLFHTAHHFILMLCLVI